MIDIDEIERLAAAAAADIDPDNVFASPWWTADYLADHERHMSITDAAFIEKASPQVVLELVSEVRRLRLSDADRAALATASSELRERRNNWAATYSRVALEQQDNAVTDSYRRTIAEVTAAIEVVDRLRGAK